MKTRQLLSLTLSFQLLFAPFTGYSADFSETFATKIAPAIGGAINQVFSNPYRTQDQAFLDRMLVPQQDEIFDGSLVRKIPGLGQYLNQIGKPNAMMCNTLRSTLDEVKSDVCTIGVVSGVDPNAQLAEMSFYADKYNSIRKLYDNYQVSSNSNQPQQFGVGCMNNALQILNGFFQQRLNVLNETVQKLEALGANFTKGSEKDLKAIGQDAAVLYGSSTGQLYSEQNPDTNPLFDFGSRFNNAACKSMMGTNDFTDKGKANGLYGLSKELTEDVNQKSGPYSAASFTGAYNTVVSDLQNMASKAAQQVQLGFGDGNNLGTILSGLSNSVSSSQGANSLLKPDMFGDVQQNFNTQNQKIQNTLAADASELEAAGLDPKLAALAKDINSTTFTSQLGVLERNIKNKCLSSNPGVQQVFSKITSPTASNHANDNATNYYKTKLQSIVGNSSSSFDQKLADIQSTEATYGSNYIVGNSTPITLKDCNGNSKTVTYTKASQYLDDVMDNCNCQFSKNVLGSSKSGAQIISDLKKANQDYKNLTANTASQIKDQISKRLITCQDAQTASGSVQGTCSSESFNMTKSSFCANNALSCSKNMQTCANQAANFVKEISNDLNARVRNYNEKEMPNYKASLQNVFKAALAAYETEAKALAAAFNTGFTSPTGIGYEVPESERYLNKYKKATSGESELLLEDPAAYLKLFKNNIDILKKSVQAQQDAILGSKGPIAQHIKDTQENYRAVADQADRMAGDCMSQVANYKQAASQQLAEQQQKNQELGEQQSELCAMYQTAQSDPKGACSGAVEDMTSAMRSSYNQFKAYCRKIGAEDPSESESSNDDELIGRICYSLDSYKKFKDSKKDKKDFEDLKGTAQDCARYFVGNSVTCELIEVEKDGKTSTQPDPNCRTTAASRIKAENQFSSNQNSTSFDSAPVPSFCSVNNTDRSTPEGILGNLLKSSNSGSGAVGN